jgi:hypothetical protein
MARRVRRRAEGYAELTWPIGSPVNTDHFVSNYLDHDPTEVGPTTVHKPRFRPLNGRSFRLEGTELRDTLRVHPLCEPVSISPGDAPSCVSLVDDSVVVIATTPEPAVRSTFFQAYATDDDGRQDTMWYHLVAPGKPHGIPVFPIASSTGKHAGRTIPAGPALVLRRGGLYVITGGTGSTRPRLIHDLRGRRIRHKTLVRMPGH